MKLKVLHIINSMSLGGAEILLANSLSSGGLPAHTENHLAFFMHPSYLLDRIDKKVIIHFLDYKGYTDVVRLIKDIKKIIVNNKIEIVHSHLSPASFYTAIACPKKIPQVHTLHIAYSTDNDTKNIFKVLERKLLFQNKRTNLIFLSTFTKKDFLAIVKFKGNSFVLNNFIDDSFFLNKPKSELVIQNKGLSLIAVGNLREQKNYTYLFEIFKYLKEYDIHLAIYGGGPNSEPYQKIIDDNCLNITLKGSKKDIETIVNDYDLFIMSSTNEGYPLSVFEAMAAGVPLFLSNIPPLKAIVNDNALYFELNSAEEVANQLIEILNNKNKLIDMAAKASIYAEKTVRRDIYISKLVKIYEDIIENNV